MVGTAPMGNPESAPCSLSHVSDLQLVKVVTCSITRKQERMRTADLLIIHG